MVLCFGWAGLLSDSGVLWLHHWNPTSSMEALCTSSRVSKLSVSINIFSQHEIQVVKERVTVRVWKTGSTEGRNRPPGERKPLIEYRTVGGKFFRESWETKRRKVKYLGTFGSVREGHCCRSHVGETYRRRYFSMREKLAPVKLRLPILLGVAPRSSKDVTLVEELLVAWGCSTNSLLCS